jgi:hypothetical protein
MKPIPFLCAFLALSTSHLFANEPSGAFLAPATTSGEEAAGKVSVVWRVAENDPAGQWTLEVREITTGRTAKSTINKE